MAPSGSRSSASSDNNANHSVSLLGTCSRRSTLSQSSPNVYVNKSGSQTGVSALGSGVISGVASGVDSASTPTNFRAQVSPATDNHNTGSSVSSSWAVINAVTTRAAIIKLMIERFMCVQLSSRLRASVFIIGRIEGERSNNRRSGRLLQRENVLGG